MMMGEASRRDALLLTAALVGVMIDPASALEEPDPLSHIIDCHCHVFTGRDIPAAQFVLNVAAREEGFLQYKKIAAFAVEILRRFAPTVQDELSQAFPAKDLSDPLSSQVFATLTSLQQKVQTSSESTFENSGVANHLMVLGFPFAQDELRLADTNINAEASALATLRQNYTPGLAPQELLYGPGGATLMAAPHGFFLDLEHLTQFIVTDVKAFFSGGEYTALGRYLALIAIFLSYRRQNIRRLDSALGVAKPSRVRLYCPALVDFDLWLGAAPENGSAVDASQTLDDQARAMAVVARRTDSAVLVSGYMAFDPLRAAIAKIKHGSGDQSVLKTVQTAVEEQGFVGAKLYPPMGFRPWNNTRSGDSYGSFAPELVRRSLIAQGLKPDGFDIGKALDDALDEFYRYCLASDVPILAHCGDSQSAFPQAGERASPFFWQELLSRPGFGRLRVNLGHFGGLWCVGEDITDDSDESQRCRVALDESDGRKPMGKQGWPAKIVAMLSAKDASGAALYPNLYCDFADVGGLDSSRSAGAIIDFLKPSSVLATRLVYGTDWMFLALEAGYQSFAVSAQSLAKTLAMDPRDLFWRNAARFLGLTPGAATTNRLQRFYAGDRNRLALLDHLLVP